MFWCECFLKTTGARPSSCLSPRMTTAGRQERRQPGDTYLVTHGDITPLDFQAFVSPDLFLRICRGGMSACSTEEDTEGLRELVAASLERDGVLGRIKAQLRCRLFRAETVQWEPP